MPPRIAKRPTPRDILRDTIGRRSHISRQEMADFLVLLALHGGVDLRNGHVGPTVAPGATEYDRARAWARRCDGTMCISVLDGGVRYDEPGSMSPRQHADITFVPADIDAGRAEGRTIEFLRRHADRVLLVRPADG